MLNLSRSSFVIIGTIAVLLSFALSIYFFFPQIQFLFLPKASVESEVEGVNVELVDRESMVEYADSLSIWDSQQVSHIKVILIGKPQSYDLFGLPDSTIIQSSGYEKDGEVLVIRVFLHPQYVLQELESRSIAEMLTQAVYLRIAKLAEGEQTYDEEKFNKTMSELFASEHEIFSIKK